jgi:hypothetical protein
MEHWKQMMHEVSAERFSHITQELHWIGTELCDLPRYNGLSDIRLFVKGFELWVLKKKGCCH